MNLFARLVKGSRGHPRHEIGAAGDAGFGAPYHRVWEYRPLPGAGAAQWAWETLLLPRYTPIGAGTGTVRGGFKPYGSPVMVAVQGTTLVGLGGSPVGGDLTGQFTTQPLLDVTQAEAAGFQTPAYSSAPNSFELPVAGAAP